MALADLRSAKPVARGRRLLRAIAKRPLRFESGDVVGEILPPQPDYLSLVKEAAEDRLGFIIAVLDLQARLVRAA